jgi:hypothetical protein
VLYGKHPALIYLYLPVHRALGLTGLVGLSVLGTWSAALVAAALARRLRADAAAPALWLVGVGSPLFFDAFVIHAHTIAAALAGTAILAALRTIDRPTAIAWCVTPIALLVTSLLRSEGIIFAASLGIAIGGVAIRRRRADLVLLGFASTAAGGAALAIDRWASSAVAAGAPRPLDLVEFPSVTFLEGRRSSLELTVLLPGYRGTVSEVVALFGAMLLIVGVALVRRRPGDDGAQVVLVFGGLLLAGRAALGWGPIPGLLVAFAVGVACLTSLRAPLARALDVRLALAAAALFGVGVALTQYPPGGHTEWGGRYFALAVPALGGVAAAALTQLVRELPARTGRVVTATVLAAMLGLATQSIVTLRASHEHNRERTDRVLAIAHGLSDASDDPPIVLTEDEQLPRLARGRYGEVRWLLLHDGTLGEYLERLAALGVPELLLVSTQPARTIEEVPPTYEQVGPMLSHDLQYGPGGALIHLRLRAQA